MKRIIFLLFISTTVFAQTPRLKFRQIQKDTTQGSIAISNPADSQLVFSRDLYISYGADTFLILGADTIALKSDLIAEIGDSLLNYVSRTELSDSTTNIRTDVPLIIADSLLNYVNISGTQTITGAKTFTSALTQSGGDVNFDDSTFYVDATNNKVGLGTTSPVAQLSLNGNYSGSTGLNAIEIKKTGVDSAYFSIYNSTISSTVFLPIFDFQSNFTGLGGIIIGRTLDNNTSSVNLRIDGRQRTPTGVDYMVNGAKLVQFTNRNLEKAYISAEGNFYAVGDISGASITDRSDIRLKENIYNYNNGLNDVLSLNPVYYNLKDNPNKQRLGFIAQDVRDIIPQAITGNEDDGFLGITYSSISAVLTKAIQEQQAIIETQATEIEQLKTLITELSNRLTIIENN